MFCYVMLRTLGTNVAIGAIGAGALIYGVACIGIGAEVGRKESGVD